MVVGKPALTYDVTFSIHQIESAIVLVRTGQIDRPITASCSGGIIAPCHPGHVCQRIAVSLAGFQRDRDRAFFRDPTGNVCSWFGFAANQEYKDENKQKGAHAAEI